MTIQRIQKIKLIVIWTVGDYWIKRVESICNIVPVSYKKYRLYHSGSWSNYFIDKEFLEISEEEVGSAIKECLEWLHRTQHITKDQFIFMKIDCVTGAIEWNFPPPFFPPDHPLLEQKGREKIYKVVNRFSVSGEKHKHTIGYILKDENGLYWHEIKCRCIKKCQYKALVPLTHDKLEQVLKELDLEPIEGK